MEKVEQKIAKSIKKVVDITIKASFPYESGQYTHETNEDYEKRLNKCIKEFENFLRDHRSQDAVHLETERVYMDVCSVCGNEWEDYKINDADNFTSCVHCKTPTREV